MSKKRIRTILFTIVSSTLVLAFVLQLIAKPYLEDILEKKLPRHVNLDYSSLEVNIFTGSIFFSTPSISISKENQHSGALTIDLEDVEINDVDYWNLIVNQKLNIAEVTFSRPQIVFEKSEAVAEKDIKDVQLLKTIGIETIRIKNGSVKAKWRNGKRNLQLDSLHLKLTGGETDPEIINAKIPFRFASLNYGFKNLRSTINEFEELKIKETTFSDQKFTLADLNLNTKLSKDQLSKQISFERDHIGLKLPMLLMTKPILYYEQDSLFINVPNTDINGLSLDIFRDKNLPDDMTYKPLYAKVLRNLPLRIMLDTITISNSTVVYEEEARHKTKAGELRFENVGGQITNVSNFSSQEKDLEISLVSSLMGKGRLALNWAFNVNNPNQRFLASGSLLDFDTSSLNDFLQPNLRVRTEGDIQNLYFTIDGDEHTAIGDVKMRYHDFKFSVMERDKLRVNKLITFIGNLFVDDGSRADENGYRYGTLQVERHPNKSFFNYLWISLQDGILDVLSGNGKKETR